MVGFVYILAFRRADAIGDRVPKDLPRWWDSSPAGVLAPAPALPRLKSHRQGYAKVERGPG